MLRLPDDIDIPLGLESSCAPFDTDAHPLAKAFEAFVAEPQFPCVGAKSAFSRDQARVVVASDIRSSWDDLRIYPELKALVERYRTNPALFQTFVVIFDSESDLSENAFERYLWERVQSLSDKDEWVREEPDHRVSQNPDDPHFSLSFGGEAFFVVGLHPNANRPARRFIRPALVFNIHDQFEQLRNSGRYEKLRSSIIGRDAALAGSANPMLARHGEISEARQYSGRVVDDDWKCPFVPRDMEKTDA